MKENLMGISSEYLFEVGEMSKKTDIKDK